MQPYTLYRDVRTGIVWRVAADATGKVEVDSPQALAVDQLNLDQHGYDPRILLADNGYLHAWLDSVPTVS